MVNGFILLCISLLTLQIQVICSAKSSGDGYQIINQTSLLADNASESDIQILFDEDKVTIRKNKLVHDTTFSQLFKSGFIEHDFKNDDRAKTILINHQNHSKFEVYQDNDKTVIKYIMDYFDITITIPNKLFEIDLKSCTEHEQLVWYKNKYEEHVRILSLNDYKLDVITLEELEASDFMFKMYAPDEIVYDHQGFSKPAPKKVNDKYHIEHKTTKEEYQLNLLQSFYNHIKSKYGITSKTFDNIELEIAEFLSLNNVSKTKYYKQIGSEIYFIKNNVNPSLLLNIYHNKVHISNLNLLYWKLKWITCLKDISSYFIDLIDVLTKDHVISKLPANNYLMDKVFESQIFVINVKGSKTKEVLDSRNANRNDIRESTSFVVGLLYKMVIQHETLSMIYLGALKYYGSSGGSTVYKKYGVTENIEINFDATSKTLKIGDLQQYQNVVIGQITITEATHEEKRGYQGSSYVDEFRYSFELTEQFPIYSVTLNMT